MNNLPLGAENDPRAPWNQLNYESECPECGGEMEHWDSGDNWEAYKCIECGYINSNEPDYD